MLQKLIDRFKLTKEERCKKYGHRAKVVLASGYLSPGTLNNVFYGTVAESFTKLFVVCKCCDIELDGHVIDSHSVNSLRMSEDSWLDFKLNGKIITNHRTIY